MNFRADINGLRAIAVLAVVLFHFDVKGFRGGFVGVDIFFVISGYLMTGIIQSRLDLNNFNLLAFYLDRAKRIIPALLALCLTLLIVGWLFLFPSAYKELGKHTIGALTFTSNFMFATSAGYFDPGSHEKWLLHTWSLSTEWQFYILYPLLLIGLKNQFSPRAGKWLLAVTAIVLLLFSAWFTQYNPTNAFYLLPARIWELIAGGLVFVFPLKLNSRTRKVLELVGLGMIAYSCLRFRPSDVWPGWLACMPVFGTLLVIASSRPSSIFTGNRLAQFFGKNSYSIYLWHWPIAVGLHYFGRFGQTSWTIAGLFLSIVLGQISYVFIEKTFVGSKSGGERRAKSLINAAAAPLFSGLAAVGLLGVVVYLAHGFANDFRMPKIADREEFVAGYQNDLANKRADAYRFECGFFDEGYKSAKQKIDPECTHAAGKGSIFLWGDSHAQALSLGLRTLYGKRVSQVATAACRPRLRPETQFEKAGIANNCDLSNRFAFAEIVRLKPETVILTQSGGFESTDWDAFADRLHLAGVSKVILAGPLPKWSPSLPLVVARNQWFNKHEGYLQDGIEKSQFLTDRALSDLYGKSKKLTYVSMIQTLCRDAACLGFVPGTHVLTAFDYGHLTPEGSIYAVKHSLFALILFDDDLKKPGE